MSSKQHGGGAQPKRWNILIGQSSLQFSHLMVSRVFSHQSFPQVSSVELEPNDVTEEVVEHSAYFFFGEDVSSVVEMLNLLAEPEVYTARRVTIE